ncbi:MAG: peptidase M16 [Candidatus Marinimicrobia bacterium]|nr:peptidase M16 [Candidatus Neomarinimicrobiota bacterium]
MFKKLLTLFILALFITSCAVINNTNSNQSLQMDPKIKTGVLDNGLTYYVLENVKPEKRAELLLLVNAGSILEEDHQQGIAHFTEHMAFNGTKNFPKQELVNYLESIGLKFGPDLNAFTSFDMTVYMLQVPTDDSDKFNTAFKILEEWSHNLTMDHEEIDKERGVVLEELRIGKGARERMLNKKLPVYLKGSKYADRLPIGKEDIIKSFDYSATKDFYNDWYRPDLMAIVAVGDFDGEHVEQKIKNQFSIIPAHPNPKKRKEYDVPFHDETRYLVVSDPEATGSSVGISYKFSKIKSNNSLLDIKNNQLISMFTEMFNNRLSERTKNPESALIYGYNYTGSWVRSIDGFNLVAGVKPGMIEKGLQEVLLELERVLRYGFTKSEFERQKRTSLKQIEVQYNERDKTESADLRWQFLDIFFENKNSIGIEKIYKIMNDMIPTLKVSDLNSYIQLIKKSSSRVITADCPEKEGINIPSNEDLKKIDHSIKNLEINPYEDIIITSPLLAQVPLPTKIKDYKSHDEVGVMEFLLENGVRVLIKPTDFKNDEILFNAYSPGGHSLVDDSKFMSAKYASDVITESGVAGFSKIELDKFLSDKQVNVNPFIREMTEGITGSSSVSDSEVMFQLIYQYFHNPMKDQDAFEALIRNWSGTIENRNASPENVYRDSISVIMSNRHFRGRPMSSETLSEIDLDIAYEVYKNRFSDANDFTFVFVGSINPDTFMPLVLTYIGNLPSSSRKESWKDVGMKYPVGNIEKIVKRGIEEKSSVQLRFTGDFDWNYENRFLLKSMTSVFRIRLREILREDMGGTYGVWVGGYPEKNPKGTYQSIVAFGCGPDNVEPMVAEVFKQIEILKTKGIEQSYLDKIIEAEKVEHNKNIQENNYWLEVLSAYDQYEEPFLQIIERDSLYELVTNENIMESAQKYFKTDNVLKAYLYPEK